MKNKLTKYMAFLLKSKKVINSENIAALAKSNLYPHNIDNSAVCIGKFSNESCK